MWWHHVTNFFGITNEAGPGYGFFSGSGSDLGELPLFAGFVVAYHHLNCHEPSCRRVGRHTVVDADGNHHKLCRKHSPHHGDGSGRLAAHIKATNSAARARADTTIAEA
jgi:hypothetical protein